MELTQEELDRVRAETGKGFNRICAAIAPGINPNKPEDRKRVVDEIIRAELSMETKQ